MDPKLRGRPIGVTATNGRTCIIAASREAKKIGVKSVTRVWEAQQICPEIITVPAHFEKYWEITQKFLDICKDYSPFVEMFSLDEVFMDITQTKHLFKGEYKTVDRIRERIRKEIGEYITVSAGLSHNKLLSKLASGMNKPNGFMEINKKNMDDVFSKIKLTDFCGIGERIHIRLNKLGIYTAFDLRRISINTLISEFGNVEANFLKSLSLGIDDSPIISYTESPQTKSVGRNYCLPNNEYNKRLIYQNIYELCEEVSIKLRRLGKKAKTAGIYLGGSKSAHGRKTVSEYFESGGDFFSVCLLILKENGFYLENNDYVRRISVWAGNLEDSKNLSISMFSEDTKKHKLLETVDKINDRFGDHTIRNGFLLYAPNLKTVPNGWGADRFERVKLAESITY
jgi:DNA polymerase-4